MKKRRIKRKVKNIISVFIVLITVLGLSSILKDNNTMAKSEENKKDNTVFKEEEIKEEKEKTTKVSLVPDIITFSCCCQ